MKIVEVAPNFIPRGSPSAAELSRRSGADVPLKSGNRLQNLIPSGSPSAAELSRRDRAAELPRGGDALQNLIPPDSPSAQELQRRRLLIPQQIRNPEIRKLLPIPQNHAAVQAMLKTVDSTVTFLGRVTDRLENIINSEFRGEIQTPKIQTKSAPPLDTSTPQYNFIMSCLQKLGSYTTLAKCDFLLPPQFFVLLDEIKTVSDMVVNNPGNPEITKLVDTMRQRLEKLDRDFQLGKEVFPELRKTIRNFVIYQSNLQDWFYKKGLNAKIILPSDEYANYMDGAEKIINVYLNDATSNDNYRQRLIRANTHMKNATKDLNARYGALQNQSMLTNLNERDDKKSDDTNTGIFGFNIMPVSQFAASAGELEEAVKLGAPASKLSGSELKSYLDRIRTGTKTKGDKYRYPYMHRKTIVKYYDSEGDRYDETAIKDLLKQRPTKLLKKNEKMRHSDGEYEQFFNIGFAALVGIAVDEEANELVVVNTCPGAGSCKVECFAMGGGKVQFEGPWVSDGRILTYLINDPTGFFRQLKNEISNEVQKGVREKYKVSIRWHDAGDFFSPQYMDMAFALARNLPMVDFYAYTKIADVALASDEKRPENFIINWSEGAHHSQERRVKQDDPALAGTKNSRIVPTKLFADLLITKPGPRGRDVIVKGPQGQWQIKPEELSTLKDRLASEYGLSSSSILSYDEYAQRQKDGSPLQWNVIIAPGEPDLTAKDRGVLSTLLLKH